MPALTLAEGLSWQWADPWLSTQTHWVSLVPEPGPGSLGQPLIPQLSDAVSARRRLPFECTTTLIESGHTILDTMFGSAQVAPL